GHNQNDERRALHGWSPAKRISVTILPTFLIIAGRQGRRGISFSLQLFANGAALSAQLFLHK
ncbi:MAG: hypothetical protein ACTHK7_19060, partial [Aureliella sp.]